MSSPEFLHKETAVVKNTESEKVGKTEKKVESDYVKRKCIFTAAVDCGKPLWKTLWTMWKTRSFQQVFGLFPVRVAAVEKCAYRFA